MILHVVPHYAYIAQRTVIDYLTDWQTVKESKSTISFITSPSSKHIENKTQLISEDKNIVIKEIVEVIKDKSNSLL